MEAFLIASHIIAGGLVLLLGLVAMFNRKGSKSHTVVGKIYVGAMWWICLSAVLIISFYRFSAFLMVVAVLTFHSSFVGVRVVNRKQHGSHKWYDWLVAIATALFGLCLVGYGAFQGLMNQRFVLATLCAFFGVFTCKNGLNDVRFFLQKHINDRFWWLRQHISAMGGSYIAAVTAFVVQNPNFFMPESEYQWLLWIIPGVAGGFVIALAQKRWRKKIPMTHATAPGSTASLQKNPISKD